jgi:hypothetical protein
MIIKNIKELIGTWLCCHGFHKWGSRTVISPEFHVLMVRVPGTGYDCEYVCTRCGKHVIKHEGGWI